MLLNFLDKHSGSITAIATIALAIFTALYIRELRREREFRLRKEHTEELKRRVISPLIKRIEGVGEVERKYVSAKRHRSFEEIERDILFTDLINHAKDVSEAYREFKTKWEDFEKRVEKLRKEIKEYLIRTHSTRFKSQSWMKFRESLKEPLNEPIFDEYGEYITSKFFCDTLLYGRDFKLECDETILREYPSNKKLTFWNVFDDGYSSKRSAVYIREDYDKSEVVVKILELLEDCKERFREDIKEIHKLIDEINNIRKELLEMLKKLEAKNNFR